MMYNDACTEFAGRRHCRLPGSEVLDSRPEVANLNRNVLAFVFDRGRTLAYRDQRLSEAAILAPSERVPRSQHLMICLARRKNGDT